ncbi:MAG: metallophosphoesterase [Bryobacteraceae bacterium]
MKLLVFSDIHGDREALERLMDVEADYYVSAGDLVSFWKKLSQMGGPLRRRAKRLYVLPGNHESTSLVRDFCKEFGLQEFHERTLEIAGYHVAGFGYSSPTPFNTPGEYTEEEIALRLERFAGLNPLVLICHCPPYGTALDRVREGVHAGSRSVGEFIRKHEPAVFICGHIHEAEGVSVQLGKTLGINAGKRGYLLDFDTLKV